MYHAGSSSSDSSSVRSQSDTAPSSSSHSGSAASAIAASSSSVITSSATIRAYALGSPLGPQVEDVGGVLGCQADVGRRALPDEGLAGEFVVGFVGAVEREAEVLEVEP